MSKASVRSLAVQISYEVVCKNKNLSETFTQRLTAHEAQAAAVKALCYATIRHYFSLQQRWLQQVDKKPKDKIVQVLLTQALAEWLYLEKPPAIVANEAVNTAGKLAKKWAKGLINATLRGVFCQKDYQTDEQQALYDHPTWWIKHIQKDWPQDWQKILIANNQTPPLWIRSLHKPTIQSQPHPFIDHAYKIAGQDISQNSPFLAGEFSVQDASAQLAAHILKPKSGEKILDACAAPGGKTGHLLELCDRIKLDALELYPNRAKKIKQNLQRINKQANIIINDASKPDLWFKAPRYDKILLDAPCSASGIVRRHVDIKFNRKQSDLIEICQTQQQLLDAMASILTVGGSLLYATCSVFHAENSRQIEKFLKTHPNFSENTLKYPFAQTCKHGIQIITGTNDMDGFYYCYLQKNAD